MSTRKKFTLLLSGYLILVVVIIVLISLFVTLDSYYVAQKSYIDKEIKNIEHYIKGYTEKNNKLLIDWANWDETYEYINNNNDTFVNSNLTTEFFIEQELSYVIIFDYKNVAKYFRGYNLDKKEDQDVPLYLKEIDLFNNKNGLISINNLIYNYSAVSINNSSSTAIPSGKLVFIQKMEPEIVNYLNSITERNFTLSKNSNNNISEISDKGYKTTINLKYNVENSDNNMILQFTMFNQIEKLGVDNLHKAILLTVLNIAALGFILYLYVLKFVRRIEKLSGEISEIRGGGVLSQKVTITGTDELAFLGSSVNDMIDKVTYMNRKIIENATLDMLTGVFNRRVGMEKLDQFIVRAKKFHEKLTICFVDINDLKKVNDTYGHKDGDEYIKKIVELITENVRENDLVSRLGGDEFLIIFKNCEVKDAERVIKRIESDINKINDSKLFSYKMSISRGVVAYKYDMEASEFVELADKKMYVDKRRKKGLLG